MKIRSPLNGFSMAAPMGLTIRELRSAHDGARARNFCGMDVLTEFDPASGACVDP
jgi:hypothetical protein